MKFNRFDLSFWVGFIIWITETWAFGWNIHAKSGTEAVLDGISGGLMLVGVIGIIIISAIKIAAHELEDEL